MALDDEAPSPLSGQSSARLGVFQYTFHTTTFREATGHIPYAAFAEREATLRRLGGAKGDDLTRRRGVHCCLSLRERAAAAR
jgi:hypothetical protein